MAEFTDEHREILDFERQLWKYLGAKEAAVRERFGLTLIEYNQKLGWLLRRPEAEEYSPVLVRRLRRLRDQRKAFRRAEREQRARRAS